MSNVKDNALRHALAYLDKHRSVRKIYAKYAEVSDEHTRLAKLAINKLETGKDLSKEERDDIDYYEEFAACLAVAIADHTLEKDGYCKDKDGYWF